MKKILLATVICLSVVAQAAEDKAKKDAKPESKAAAAPAAGKAPDTKPNTGGAAETPGTGKSHQISQKDKKFSVTEIKVKAGDSIVFKNDEKELTHNVYSLGPKNAFDIKVQAPGKSSTVPFNEKGVTDVECAIHPNMKLKVTVE